MAFVPRMTPVELRAERDARGLGGAAFGAFLAECLGRPRPYDRREISAWETGDREIPEAVERVLLRLRLAAIGGKGRARS